MDILIYSPCAIIGNETTPTEVVEQMVRIARKLEEKNYTVRIGSDDNLDGQIESVLANYELHIPWKKFNDKEGDHCKFPKQKFGSTEPTEGENIVRRFIPVWDTFKPAVRKIIARSAHVILGEDLKSPIKFLICWSPDGCEDSQSKNAKTGRIGTAIAIAASLKIPVFNLKNGNAMERLNQHLQS